MYFQLTVFNTTDGEDGDNNNAATAATHSATLLAWLPNLGLYTYFIKMISSQCTQIQNNENNATFSGFICCKATVHYTYCIPR